MSLLALPAAASLAEELPEPINTVEARGVIIIGRFDAPSGLQGYAARYTGLKTRVDGLDLVMRSRLMLQVWQWRHLARGARYVRFGSLWNGLWQLRQQNHQGDPGYGS